MPVVNFWYVLVIAVSLSADCFAVALSTSISQKTFSFFQLLHLPLLFGVFQSFMAVMGWLAGRSIVDLISSYDHWVAFGLLAIIGVRMIWDSFHERDLKKKNMASWLTLVILSIATSIDSLAVGLSFAFIDVNITVAGITIGLTAFIITLIGMLIGKKVGVLIGERAEMVGGIILIGIGVKILLEHLL